MIKLEAWGRTKTQKTEAFHTLTNIIISLYNRLYQYYNLHKVCQDNCLKYIKNGTINIRNGWLRQKCREKRLSIANILSRISKTNASNLDTRSFEKELHQMIAKGLIDSSYKIVNNINLKLNVKTPSKNTLSNNDVKEVSSPNQSILTDTPPDIHLSTEHEPSSSRATQHLKLDW